MIRARDIFGLAPGQKPDDTPPVFLADVTPVQSIDRRRVAFVWTLLGRGFRIRLGLMAGAAIVIGIGDSLAPYMFGNLVNVLAAQVQSAHADIHVVMTAFFMLIGAWLIPHSAQRFYEMVDA